MKCQQLIIYGLIALVALYVFKGTHQGRALFETLGIKLPFTDEV